MTILNGFKRKDILYLLERFSVDDVENSFVSIYCQRKNHRSIKNLLIKNILSQSDKNITQTIASYIHSKNIDLNLKNLEKVFELLIKEKERKVNGAFYTPTFLVNYIIDKTISKGSTICDLSCGSGAFLVVATEKLAKISNKSIVETIEKNVYGADILPSSIRRTKIVLSLLALDSGEDRAKINFNLEITDSLFFDWKKKYPSIFDKGGFDAIIGNPPYVRTKNLQKDVREKIQEKWSTASGGNIDLYIPFVELGINLLNKGGKLGYILPNSYFSSLTSKKLRNFLREGKYLQEIVDFNHLQMFEDATTYVCISIFDKRTNDSFGYTIIHDPEKAKELKKLEFVDIKFTELGSNNWILLNKRDYLNIKKIENIGIPLGKIADIHTGIATLRNDLFVIENAKKIGGYFEKEYLGKKYKIESAITKEVVKASVLKDEKDILNNKRQIIFPYVRSGIKLRIIGETQLREKFPECYKYFLAIKPELSMRDKGKGRYEAWYAYGRTQGLDAGSEFKIISPDISSKPRFVVSPKKDILFYGGYSISLAKQASLWNGPLLDLHILKKILNSEVFWYYVNKTSRNYSSGYKSFAKHFITNFSIPTFTLSEVAFLRRESNSKELNRFLSNKYGVTLT